MVNIYHDSTDKTGNRKLTGHIFFFVPDEVRIVDDQPTLFNDIPRVILSKKILHVKIEDIRKQFNFIEKFHYKNIGGDKTNKYDEAKQHCICHIVDALRHNRQKLFTDPLFCKMAIMLYPNAKDLSKYGGNKKEKKLRYHETLLRMLFKGAVHYLYNANNRVKIKNIISDGEPYHRKLSEFRIVHRSEFEGLREYVEIDENSTIIHQSSNHKDFTNDSDGHINANMLQAADLLLGGVRYSCYGESTNKNRDYITKPIKDMIEKRDRKKGFVNSGHYNSFIFSEAEIKNGKWEFNNDIDIKKSFGQIELAI